MGIAHTLSAKLRQLQLSPAATGVVSGATAATAEGEQLLELHASRLLAAASLEGVRLSSGGDAPNYSNSRLIDAIAEAALATADGCMSSLRSHQRQLTHERRVASERQFSDGERVALLQRQLEDAAVGASSRGAKAARCRHATESHSLGITV